MRNTIIATTLFVAIAASSLDAQEEPSTQEPAKGERPAIAATISDGKPSKFGFISHTISCPTYFDRFRKGRMETIEVLLPDKMVSGERYPVMYALAPLTSAGVVDHYKLSERHHVGPLMDIR